ncbi:MarR family winged helix-turn-helix transcriptional regulator [Actinoalloteichus hymeniacidonis]|uniref:Transcriptional regulator n=1 Tax=Actinoalloteichus hymeniacidonis TaxID=340345 RepID=A0AAC9HNF5_9PSEU|nr:MarR family winged helix-turn-helix transcriptional regulator [Actinoalloteichus hymeniacidonis]AOS62554.1 transcriptional regulator [Actinoalloteichus hymeniacidonis]MBB5909415.1 DNA-binding MarR family transcriptional regulator [Actinoalloteichus hymeniacidonis]
MTDEIRTPIGFWLKHLDQLIEDGFDAALATADLSRRQWQVLSVLRARPRETPELIIELQPFLTLPDAERLLADLERRGWISDRSGRHELTADGVVAWSAAAEHAHEFRSLTASGVSDEDYRTTLRVLRTMAGNLSAAAATSGAGEAPRN